MFSDLIDFVFPKQSLTGVEGSWITTQELQGIVRKPVVLFHEELGRNGMPAVDCLLAATGYARNVALQQVLYLLKYKRVPHVEYALTRLLTEALEMVAIPPDAYLCPVPLHWSRFCSRGFNQSTLIAKRLADELALPLCPVLVRSKATGHQAHRHHAERHDIMRNAFRVKQNVPDTIILIDDVVTTGATVQACASTLKNAGATTVHVWCVAKG